jgi:hypothetical protein
LSDRGPGRPRSAGHGCGAARRHHASHHRSSLFLPYPPYYCDTATYIHLCMYEYVSLGRSAATRMAHPELWVSAARASFFSFSTLLARKHENNTESGFLTGGLDPFGKSKERFIIMHATGSGQKLTMAVPPLPPQNLTTLHRFLQLQQPPSHTSSTLVRSFTIFRYPPSDSNQV